MFCPQCGQQQVSGEMRFCSRCGFPLGGVIQLLPAEAWPRRATPAGASPRQLSPRRKGLPAGRADDADPLIATPLGHPARSVFPEMFIPLTAIHLLLGRDHQNNLRARLLRQVMYLGAGRSARLCSTRRRPRAVRRGRVSTALPPQRSAPCFGLEAADEDCRDVAAAERHREHDAAARR